MKTNVAKNANCYPVGNVRRDSVGNVVNIVKVARSIFATIVMELGKSALPKNATTV